MFSQAQCDFYRSRSSRCRRCGGTSAENHLQCRLWREVGRGVSAPDLLEALVLAPELTEKAEGGVETWPRE